MSFHSHMDCSIYEPFPGSFRLASRLQCQQGVRAQHAPQPNSPCSCDHDAQAASVDFIALGVMSSTPAIFDLSREGSIHE